MEVDALKDIAVGLSVFLAAALSIWNFFQSPSKKNADAISTINTKLIDHDRRIQTVEGELRHLPDKEVVHELKVAIVELQGTVKALDVQLGAVGRTVANIDSYMRKDDGK